MARNYKLVEVRNHPQNPLNISTVIEVTDSENGEIIRLTDRIFASDLTPDVLAKQLGAIESNVMVPRAEAKAALQALQGQDITPILPVPVDPLQQAYDDAIRVLRKYEEQIALKLIASDDPDYLVALDEAKAAKAALNGSK